MSHVLARDPDSPCVLLGIALSWSIMSGFSKCHINLTLASEFQKNIAQIKIFVELGVLA